jgi:hypothetical protein
MPPAAHVTTDDPTSDRFIIAQFDDHWITAGIDELRRRAIVDETPDADAFQGLADWLDKAGGKASILYSVGIHSSLDGETIFGEREKSSGLGNALELDCSGQFLSPEQAQALYRSLKRLALLRGVVIDEKKEQEA